MKQFDDMQKRMPYAESKDYLDRLIEQSTEKAIRQATQPKAEVRQLRPLLAVAAAVALLLAIGITQFRSHDEQMLAMQQEQETLGLLADNSQEEGQERGPIDDFLSNLTDDEAQLLAYYEWEDVPEYE